MVEQLYSPCIQDLRSSGPRAERGPFQFLEVLLRIIRTKRNRAAAFAFLATLLPDQLSAYGDSLILSNKNGLWIAAKV
jgi:hypothetical protein